MTSAQLTPSKVLTKTQLRPDIAISLQLNKRLIKLDVKRMEFFLINAMIAINQKNRFIHHCDGLWTFRVNDFLESLVDFPEIIIPDKRKRRAYLSSILAKHEIHRNDIYNKQLFVRIMRGSYILNPELMLKIEGGWLNPYLFWLHHHQITSDIIPKVKLDEIVLKKDQHLKTRVLGKEAFVLR